MSKKPKTEDDTPRVKAAPIGAFTLAETTFSTIEAADYLRISRAGLYRLIERGEIKTFPIGGRTLIHGTEIARYVNTRIAAA